MRLIVVIIFFLLFNAILAKPKKRSKLSLSQSLQEFMESEKFGEIKNIFKKKLMENQPDEEAKTVTNFENSEVIDENTDLKNCKNHKVLLKKALELKRHGDNLVLTSEDQDSSSSRSRTIEWAKKGFNMFQEGIEAKSNAMKIVCHLISDQDTDRFTFFQAGRLCIDLAIEVGDHDQLIKGLRIMVDQYPQKLEYSRELAYRTLMQANICEAQKILEGILRNFSEKCSARDQYLLGLVLKLQGKVDLADDLIDFAKINRTESTATFSQIGNHFARKNLRKQADIVFEEGAKLGLFLSPLQRSGTPRKELLIKGLKAKPVWTLEESGYSYGLRKMEDNFEVIRDEGLKALFGNAQDFPEEAENLREEGQWQQLVLFENGRTVEKGCSLAPKTCSLVRKYLKEEAVECKHGQVKFSVIHPGTHVYPHSGPTNCRLRAHLGLYVPGDEIPGRLELRIARDNYLNWQEGKVIIIDDSFEHELWHQKVSKSEQNQLLIRMILLIDLWHPDLTEDQKRTLSPLVPERNHTTIFTVGGLSEKVSVDDHDEL